MHAHEVTSARASYAGRLLGGGLLALVLWLVLAAVAPASGLACSNVEFIGVRGSGESYSGNYGMGTQIAGLYEQVKARRPAAQTLQSYGLEYPAINVAEWWKAFGYYPSVWEGDSHLESRVKGDASACPGMKILIGGFSQGAHVVGDTIENLTNKNDSSLAHIYGVALYGDPRFSKDDGTVARGNYSHEHWGILTERGNYSSKINNRLGDWCRLKDAICQGFNAGDTEHHEYRNYEGGLFLTQGASMMFSHIGW
jgi:acetylxylan esterase